MVDIRPVGDVASRECDGQIDREEEELFGPGHEVGVEEHGRALHKSVKVHVQHSIREIEYLPDEEVEIKEPLASECVAP